MGLLMDFRKHYGWFRENVLLNTSCRITGESYCPHFLLMGFPGAAGQTLWETIGMVWINETLLICSTDH